jgi:hypothetical protein
MEGLQWIADAMESSPGLGKWFRKRTGEALVSFLDAVLAEHIDELKRNESARDALISLTAHAVSKQLKGALTLQERAKRLL